MHADFRGNQVGRVPSRGEQDVFEQDPNDHDLNLTMNKKNSKARLKRLPVVGSSGLVFLLGSIIVVLSDRHKRESRSSHPRSNKSSEICIPGLC